MGPVEEKHIDRVIMATDGGEFVEYSSADAVDSASSNSHGHHRGRDSAGVSFFFRAPLIPASSQGALVFTVVVAAFFFRHLDM